MNRRSKNCQKEKNENQQKTLQIQKLIDKNIIQNNVIQYLVQFKDQNQNKSFQWIDENKLILINQFKDKLKIFNQSSIIKQKMQKEINNNKIDKISSNKQQFSQHLQKKTGKSNEINCNKQSFLDNFIRTNNLQFDQIKRQNSLHKINQPSIVKSTQLIKNKLNQNYIQDKLKLKQSKKQALINWIDKINSIRQIKGYHLTQNLIFYHLDVYDKNGQTIFVPPLASETVYNLDRVKTAKFLHNCLIKGIEQQRSNICSKTPK